MFPIVGKPHQTTSSTLGFPTRRKRSLASSFINTFPFVRKPDRTSSSIFTFPIRRKLSLTSSSIGTLPFVERPHETTSSTLMFPIHRKRSRTSSSIGTFPFVGKPDQTSSTLTFPIRRKRSLTSSSIDTFKFVGKPDQTTYSTLTFPIRRKRSLTSSSINTFPFIGKSDRTSSSIFTFPIRQKRNLTSYILPFRRNHLQVSSVITSPSRSKHLQKPVFTSPVMIKKDQTSPVIYPVTRKTSTSSTIKSPFRRKRDQTSDGKFPSKLKKDNSSFLAFSFRRKPNKTLASLFPFQGKLSQILAPSFSLRRKREITKENEPSDFKDSDEKLKEELVKEASEALPLIETQNKNSQIPLMIITKSQLNRDENGKDLALDLDQTFPNKKGHIFNEDLRGVNNYELNNGQIGELNYSHFSKLFNSLPIKANGKMSFGNSMLNPRITNSPNFVASPDFHVKQHLMNNFLLEEADKKTQNNFDTKSQYKIQNIFQENATNSSNSNSDLVSEESMPSFQHPKPLEEKEETVLPHQRNKISSNSNSRIQPVLTRIEQFALPTSSSPKSISKVQLALLSMMQNLTQMILDNHNGSLHNDLLTAQSMTFESSENRGSSPPSSHSIKSIMDKINLFNTNSNIYITDSGMSTKLLAEESQLSKTRHLQDVFKMMQMVQEVMKETNPLSEEMLGLVETLEDLAGNAFALQKTAAQSDGGNSAMDDTSRGDGTTTQNMTGYGFSTNNVNNMNNGNDNNDDDDGDNTEGNNSTNTSDLNLMTMILQHMLQMRNMNKDKGEENSNKGVLETMLEQVLKIDAGMNNGNISTADALAVIAVKDELENYDSLPLHMQTVKLPLSNTSILKLVIEAHLLNKTKPSTPKANSDFSTVPPTRLSNTDSKNLANKNNDLEKILVPFSKNNKKNNTRNQVTLGSPFATTFLDQLNFLGLESLNDSTSQHSKICHMCVNIFQSPNSMHAITQNSSGQINIDEVSKIQSLLRQTDVGDSSDTQSRPTFSPKVSITQVNYAGRGNGVSSLSKGWVPSVPLWLQVCWFHFF